MPFGEQNGLSGLYKSFLYIYYKFDKIRHDIDPYFKRWALISYSLRDMSFYGRKFLQPVICIVWCTLHYISPHVFYCPISNYCPIFIYLTTYIINDPVLDPEIVNRPRYWEIIKYFRAKQQKTRKIPKLQTPFQRDNKNISGKFLSLGRDYRPSRNLWAKK